MNIPEIINNYNVYSNGKGADGKATSEKIVGIGDEISMPEIASRTYTVSGAGIMGDFDESVLSQFEAMNMEIPFRIFYGDIKKVIIVGKTIDLTIRGAVQGIDTGANGETTACGIKIDVKGKVVKVSPGKFKQGESMGCAITVNPFYFKASETADAKNFKEIVEIDVFNEVYEVDGADMLADIKKFT